MSKRPESNGESSSSHGSEAPGAPGFEHSLARLEEIVAELESGDLELEQALSIFEEGVRLSRSCAEQLGAAERRVEELLGDRRTRPFQVPEDEG